MMSIDPTVTVISPFTTYVMTQSCHSDESQRLFSKKTWHNADVLLSYR